MKRVAVPTKSKPIKRERSEDIAIPEFEVKQITMEQYREIEQQAWAEKHREIEQARAEKQRNSARFFRANELKNVTVGFIKSLSIDELRTIDPRIVIFDGPADNTFVVSPSPYSIGVPKDRAAYIIQQLESRSEVYSVNKFLTPAGMAHMHAREERMGYQQ